MRISTTRSPNITTGVVYAVPVQKFIIGLFSSKISQALGDTVLPAHSTSVDNGSHTTGTNCLKKNSEQCSYFDAMCNGIETVKFLLRVKALCFGCAQLKYVTMVRRGMEGLAREFVNRR